MVLVFVVFFSVRGMSQDEFDNVFAAVPVETAKVAEPATDERVETSVDRFHRALIAAAQKQVRDGKLKRGDLIRLRVAMLSPSFRRQAEDLAIIQMSASGEDGLPIGEDGLVDRAAIDWDKLLDFITKLIPIILDLIKALS